MELSNPRGSTNTLLVLLVAAAISLAVGLLNANGWPGLVIGAVLALSLWVMLFFGSPAQGGGRALPAAHYAPAAVVAVALGYLFFKMMGDNGSAWAIGFIVAGVPLASLYSRGSRNRGDIK